jgi:hypothetical protein
MGEGMAGSVKSVALGGLGGRKVAVSAGDDRTVRLRDLATPTVTGKVLGGKLDTRSRAPPSAS